MIAKADPAHTEADESPASQLETILLPDWDDVVTVAKFVERGNVRDFGELEGGAHIEDIGRALERSPDVTIALPEDPPPELVDRAVRIRDVARQYTDSVRIVGLPGWRHGTPLTFRPDMNTEGLILAWLGCLPDFDTSTATRRNGHAHTAEPKIDLGIMNASAFMAVQRPREWLIEDVLVKDRPCVVGGPKKTLKTSLMVELVVALAGAVPLLGRFHVPTRRRVLLLSGESGIAVIQETVRRVCAARGVDPGDLDGQAFFGETLPRLDNAAHLKALEDFIRQNGIGVVIIDPLYLCLLSSGTRVDAANLFEVGPLLQLIAGVISRAGATPLLVHHFRKNRESPHGTPELEDLAFAGVQEFARQWLLLGRREKYVPGSGEHKLWFSVGGSDGHSGEWALDIAEGVVGSDFGDRKWEVAVSSPYAAVEETRATEAQQKAEKRREKEAEKQAELDQDAAKALEVLEKMGPTTETQWRERLNWNSRKIGAARERLLDTGRIHRTEVEVSGRSGSRRKMQGFGAGPPLSVFKCTGDYSDFPDFPDKSPGLGPRPGDPDYPD